MVSIFILVLLVRKRRDLRNFYIIKFEILEVRHHRLFCLSIHDTIDREFRHWTCNDAYRGSQNNTQYWSLVNPARTVIYISLNKTFDIHIMA